MRTICSDASVVRSLQAVKTSAGNGKVAPRTAPTPSSLDLECRSFHGGIATRRTILTSAAAVSGLSLIAATEAKAGLVDDFARQVLRPDVDPDQAVVSLLDARGVLYEIKALASSPADSQERFKSKSLIPGFAKRLREVGAAAPVVVSLITGEDKDAALSEQYGGSGGDASMAVPVYNSVGRVLTLSGRGIRPEALESAAAADSAIQSIDDLLAKLPEPVITRAAELRAQRQRVV